MNEYTLECTSEQTIRAWKLGAPLENFDPDNSNGVICGKDGIKAIPTTQQMINWLQDKKEIVVHVFVANTATEFDGWSYEVIKDFQNGGWENTISVPDAAFKSSPEATFAGINAALDYLEQKGGTK